MAIATTIRRAGATLVLAAILGSCGSTPPPQIAAPTPSPSATPTATPASSGGPQLAAVPPIAWTDCGSGFQCGSLLVPRDYGATTGASFLISVIRLPATDAAHRIGSLVVNPGGPGGSGVDFVRNDAKVVFGEAIRAKFDIVGFDPRGVNESSGIRCVDDLEHFLAADDTPDTPAELQTLLDGDKTFAAGCAARNADVLPYIGTDNVVRDMDRLRAALGDAKLTYVGFSYGTLIGSLYAQSFPNRVRALVLDGALDPTLDMAAIGRGQAAAFETELKRFLADCAADSKCAFHHGGKPGPAFEALMRRIEKTPLPAVYLRDPRLVGPSYAWSAVLGALYSRTEWPLLAQGLALAERGDGSILLLLSDPLDGRDSNGQYSDLIDANTAITCIDFPGPRDAAAYETEAKAWAKVAPHFGALIAYSDLACAYWPVPSIRKLARVSADGAAPIVIIGTTGDPATPYPWAVALSHQLTSSVLITRQGDGHTGYVYSACVRTATDAYLLDLTVPKKGLTCKSDSGG